MTDYNELKRLVDRVLTDRRFCGDENHKALAGGVLALIAENERLSKDRTDWQAECIKRGFTYCRVPDDHYVLADVPEMADLLGLLLGVEVRDRENDSYGDTVSSLTDQVDAGIDAFHRAYEAEKERDQLKAENELARMRIKELDLLFGRYILAMRSALIEEEHGKGPAAAMEWIYNSLAGPGELPPEGEADSHAYFDREIVAVDDGMQEVMAFYEGRRAAMRKGEQS